MNKLLRRFDSILLTICMISMGLMGLLVIISVILRYIFGISYVWATELVTCLFIFTTFFGAAIAVKSKEHIRIDFFLKMMPESVQHVIAILTEIVIIIVQIQVLRSSMVWISKVGRTSSIGFGIPCKYIYIMLPISAGFIIFYCLRYLLSKTGNLFTGSSQKEYRGADK